MSFFPRVIENDVDTTTCRKRIDIDEYTRAAKSASFLLCTTVATRIFIPFTPNLRTFLLCPFFSFIRQRNYPAKRSVAAKRMKEAAARCKLVLFGRFIAYSFADFQRSWTCYSRESVENPLNKSNVVRTHRWLKQFFKMSYDTWRWKKCREATCTRWLTKRRRVSSEIEASRSVVDSARPSGCCRNLWLL